MSALDLVWSMWKYNSYRALPVLVQNYKWKAEITLDEPVK